MEELLRECENIYTAPSIKKLRKIDYPLYEIPGFIKSINMNQILLFSDLF